MTVIEPDHYCLICHYGYKIDWSCDLPDFASFVNIVKQMQWLLRKPMEVPVFGKITITYNHMTLQLSISQGLPVELRMN